MAFYNCSSLATLTILGPANKDLTIGKNAFFNCSLSKIYVPNKDVLEKIKSSGFSINDPVDGKYTF